MGHLVTLWHSKHITCTNQIPYLNGLQFIPLMKDLARTRIPLMSLKHKRSNKEVPSSLKVHSTFTQMEEKSGGGGGP